MTIRYHVTARKLSGGNVQIRELGLGSFLYSVRHRQNLKDVAENIIKQTPYTTIFVQPQGRNSFPIVYIRTASNDSATNIHHIGYSTESFLKKMGLKIDE
jgi:hypothetical protein